MSGAALWVGVALLGGAGSVLRLLVDERITRRVAPSARFPLGIFVVNVTGSFVAGLLAGAALSPDASLLAATAFVGAYTTFSTWMLDTIAAASARAVGVAAANVGLSLVAGLAAAAAGRALGAGF